MFDPARLRDLQSVFIHRQQPDRQPQRVVMHPGRESVELMISGRGWIEDPRAGQIEVGPGDLLWHREGEALISRSDPRDPYCCLAVRFLTVPGTPCPAARRSRWSHPLEPMTFARHAVACYTDGTTDRRLLLLHLYSTFLVETLRPTRPQGLPVEVERCLRMIEDDFRAPFSVEDLARAVGWSAAHLHAEFRTHLRSTPYGYVQERRMREVRALLVGDGGDLAEIADRTGFSSSTALCRAFRRLHGITPSDYRRKHRC